MSEPIVLAFRAYAPRERVRRHLRGLLGPRALVYLFALGPGITLYASGANPPFPSSALLIGLGLAAFSVMAGVLDALLRPTAPFTIEIDEERIRETRAGVTTERPRDWVLGVARDGDTLVLRIRPDAMRSFRLAQTKPTELHVDARATSPETIDRLERILGIAYR